MIRRTLPSFLDEILRTDRKMAFVSGPRQVGKTTLAREYAGTFSQSVYFNWDVVPDQKRLLKDPYFFEKENRDAAKPFLVVFDEIHKYARWKNYLKGAFDGFREEFRFLVTGSGRLDLFKKGGDSLLGRYEGAPLFPLTVGECLGRFPTFREFKAGLAQPPSSSARTREIYERLFRFSGFPEPFTRGRENFYNRWFQGRRHLLIREDIRDAGRLREISLLEILSHLIPERVGAPLSLNSMREDVGVAFETIRDWVLLLEQFYYLFRIQPFTGSLSRSLKKEAKAYLYDWVEVPQRGPRFENLVALHLWKAVHLWRARGEGDISLHYLRDKEKREVDFLVTEKNVPVCLVECKLSEDGPSPALARFQEVLSVSTAVQLVDVKGVGKKTSSQGRSLWTLSADRWLAGLP